MEEGVSNSDNQTKLTEQASKKETEGWGAKVSVIWQLLSGGPTPPIPVEQKIHVQEVVPQIWVMRDPYIKGTFLIGSSQRGPTIYVTKVSPLYKEAEKFHGFQEEVTTNHITFQLLKDLLDQQSDGFFNMRQTFQTSDNTLLTALDSQIAYLKSLEFNEQQKQSQFESNVTEELGTADHVAVPMFDATPNDGQRTGSTVVNRHAPAARSKLMTVQRIDNEAQSDHEAVDLKESNYFMPAYDIQVPHGGRFINPIIWLMYLYNNQDILMKSE